MGNNRLTDIQHEHRGALDSDHIKELLLRFDTTAETGSLTVAVQPDGMAAYLDYSMPDNSPSTPMNSTVMNLLESYGVCFGILEDSLDGITFKGSGRVMVARGKRPVKGRDGEIRCVANKDARKAEDAASGSVDMRQVNTYCNVLEGDVIAEKTPPHSGIDGTTVTGKKAAAPAGREAVLVAGKNTRLSENGDRLIATAAGMLAQRGDRFDIHDVLEIRGDVNYSVGNIDFAGFVRIHGDVLPGFTVVSASGIEIDGTVENATLESGGSISVKRGCYGGPDSSIKATGKLSARSIDNCVVTCSGDICVEQHISNSKVVAGGNVEVTHPRHGKIIGGSITAGGDIISPRIGSPNNVRTVIESGVAVFTGNDRNFAFNMMRYYETSIEKVEKAINWLKSFNEMSSAHLESLAKLDEKLTRQKRHLEEFTAKYDAITHCSRRHDEVPKIIAKSTLYKGVKINSRGAYMSVQDDMHNVVVKLKGDELAAGPA